MSGLISISGLASGLDIDGIISKIMEFESRGVTRLESRVAVQKQILGGFGTFESRLLALQVNFSKLSNEISFRGKTVTTSDESILTASASTSAARGTFTLTVDRLAQTHQIVSQGFASNTSEIGTGTFSVTVGDRSPVEITIDSNNNTLESLMETINETVTGASASIINTGDPDEPYVLLITGEDTGSNERIVVDANLAGGTTPRFGTVDTVVEGGKTGTSTVSSLGSYTGDSDATMTYTVTSGGTIGVDNITVDYEDGNGLTGSFTISSEYVPGEDIHVFGGLNLSFSAGTLDVNDSWSTDVTSSSIQAPLDAEFTLGNSLGGGGGITLTSHTNTVSDVIDGMTFNLHKASADPVTINVDDDTDAVRDNIEAMVEQYNGFVDMMDELFYFDLDTGERGTLLGDRVTIDLYNEIQLMLSSVAEGVTGSFESMGDIGITLSGDGKLNIDTGILDDALNNNLDSVKQLFAVTGRTTDSNVRFLGASGETVAYSVTGDYQQGYDVSITQAAEKAVVTGASITEPSPSSPITINSSNSGLRIAYGNKTTGDLLLTEGVYHSGDALAAEIQAKIDASGDVREGAVSVTYIDDGGGQGHFEFTSREYGSSQTIEIETVGNSIYSAIGYTEGTTANGKDVSGTINGEAAKGVGQILTGNDDNEYTDGLRLLVNITPTELASQGENQGSVLVTKGVGVKMKELFLRVTEENGMATLREKELNDRIDIIQDRIDAMEERLEMRRERLIKEFLRLESVISQLQGQQDYLAQGLTALSQTTQSVVNSRR